MRFSFRFVADAVAIFLALYLVDSVAEGRFLLQGVWAAVILALLLGFINSLIRPLHRARSKLLYAAVWSVATLLINALIVQALAWAGALDVAGFHWVLLAALLLCVVTGAINWSIGFGSSERKRPTTTQTTRQPSTHTKNERPVRRSR